MSRRLDSKRLSASSRRVRGLTGSSRTNPPESSPQRIQTRPEGDLNGEGPQEQGQGKGESGL